MKYECPVCRKQFATSDEVVVAEALDKQVYHVSCFLAIDAPKNVGSPSTALMGTPNADCAIARRLFKTENSAEVGESVIEELNTPIPSKEYLCAGHMQNASQCLKTDQRISRRMIFEGLTSDRKAKDDDNLLRGPD